MTTSTRSRGLRLPGPRALPVTTAYASIPHYTDFGGCVAGESEGQETGAEATAAGVDPAAIALALSGASREQADAFLHDQRALIADQRHHLREQFKQLRLSVFGQRLSIALKGLTAVIGVAVVIVWQNIMPFRRLPGIVVLA